MRGPLDDADDEDEPPTWNIWEYNIATDTLHRVITSNIIAEEGQDVAPAYLPDGRILFSSTRQRQSKAILLDENKAQFEAATEARNESAFVLHVMNGDGTDVHQISFNPSSDLYPTVLQNGRVLFTRWDRAPGRDGLHLYSSNPDGTDTQLYYGALSHLTGTAVGGVNTPIEFMRAREMSDGRLMVLVRGRTDVDFGGNLTIIDGKTYVENTQPLAANAGMAGPAQTPATLNDVRTIPGPSPGGRFQSGFPLWDGSGRILVSWSQCRLLDVGGSDPTRIIPCDNEQLADPNAQTARPLYSIWMFTPAQNTILPVMAPVEGVMVTEALAAQPRNPLPVGDPRQEAAAGCESGPGVRRRRHSRDPQRVRHHGCRPGARRRRRAPRPSPACRIPRTRSTRSAPRASSASRNPSRYPTMTTSPTLTTPPSAPPA